MRVRSQDVLQAVLSSWINDNELTIPCHEGVFLQDTYYREFWRATLLYEVIINANNQ